MANPSERGEDIERWCLGGAPFSALSLPCFARSVCLRSVGEGANPPCSDALILLDSLIQFLLSLLPMLMLMLLVCRLRSFHNSLFLSSYNLILASGIHKYIMSASPCITMHTLQKLGDHCSPSIAAALIRSKKRSKESGSC